MYDVRASVTTPYHGDRKVKRSTVHVRHLLIPGVDGPDKNKDSKANEKRRSLLQ